MEMGASVPDKHLPVKCNVKRQMQCQTNDAPSQGHLLSAEMIMYCKFCCRSISIWEDGCVGFYIEEML